MIPSRVEAHYARPNENLEESILSAVSASGKDPDRLTPDDLGSIDQFHIRGRKATVDLARELGLDQNKQVLDVGSGLGGASRFLASEYGCQVIGLDLCKEYCRVATSLTRRMGLDSLASFCHGNAVEMPFADGLFDIVWTQHTAMNIPDKKRLYGEIWRVLKPGGRLAIYDILAGTGGDVIFPVPWAQDTSISFLYTAPQLMDVLREAGFKILVWRDVTSAGRDWFGRMQEKIAQKEPVLGLQLLLGPHFQLMACNQLRNLNEARIALVEAIVTRP
ncbi:Sarcosine/dimethylglycine N-methyltransferase [Rhodocyclaceae bacterium]|nr:Sarcosine/dimethylglycine N-methyltransferase [Rhodocyclaceae bacterium]